MKFGEEKALKNRENEKKKKMEIIWSDLVLCWLL